jgi:penicillin amidase
VVRLVVASELRFATALKFLYIASVPKPTFVPFSPTNSMRPRTKFLIGMGATLAVVLVAMVVLAYYLITKSFPTTSGTLALKGLSGDVEVLRDDYGVPFVSASNERDLYFAVGFVQAQDRMWQMELIRRAGMGRLAEILGEPALKTDRMFRTLGIHRHAKEAAVILDDTMRHILQAYADGVNAYIEHSKGSYPLEFDLLSIEPEPWTIEHSLMVPRLMAWELNHARWVDLIFGELVERFGEARALEIFPSWREDAPVIVPEPDARRRVAGLLSDLLEADRDYRALLGMEGFHGGSNAWVVSGANSTTGKPLLANDPHLVLTTPPRWHDVTLSAPGVEVTGASIPGVPFIVIGRNRSIAWGVTNAMADDQDFYVEEVDSLQHPTRYRFNNSWRPVTQTVDTILVKDGNPVILTVYHTHRGPIVNRMEPGARFSKKLVSMRWVGSEQSNEGWTFYLLNRATNWRDFVNALRHFAVPAQNFVYADADGNIGYRTGGKLPIRAGGTLSIPFPGDTDRFDWKGFVPFDEMPQSFNPPEGFIVTANNKIVPPGYRHYISHHWEPPWRAVRITELLRAQEKHSVEDFQRMQSDVGSPHAREVVPLILAAFESRTDGSPELHEALTHLRNWSFEMTRDDVATSIFQSFFVRLIHNTLHDELGPEMLALYDTLASIPMVAVTNLLLSGNSSWFDNVDTPEVESRDDIIRQSFVEGLDRLRGMLGGELKEWRWGRLHKVEFGHVFGSNSLLRPMVSVGPFEAPGSHSTVWKGDYRIANPFTNHVGPSTRRIADLSDVNDTRVVTPPGHSGHVFYRHYKDQATLWLQGGYRTMAMDRQAAERTARHRLTLRPAR